MCSLRLASRDNSGQKELCSAAGRRDDTTLTTTGMYNLVPCITIARVCLGSYCCTSGASLNLVREDVSQGSMLIQPISTVSFFVATVSPVFSMRQRSTGNEAPEVTVHALYSSDDTPPSVNDSRVSQICAVPNRRFYTHAMTHQWTEVLPRVPLGPSSRHLFKVPPSTSVNYVKLSMYPDGGIVCRLPHHLSLDIMASNVSYRPVSASMVWWQLCRKPRKEPMISRMSIRAAELFTHLINTSESGLT